MFLNMNMTDNACDVSCSVLFICHDDDTNASPLKYPCFQLYYFLNYAAYRNLVIICTLQINKFLREILLECQEHHPFSS